MAKIQFTFTDVEGEQHVDIQRKVLEDDNTEEFTAAKSLSVAISYCLDNPYMIQNILTTASEEAKAAKKLKEDKAEAQEKTVDAVAEATKKILGESD